MPHVLVPFGHICNVMRDGRSWAQGGNGAIFVVMPHKRRTYVIDSVHREHEITLVEQDNGLYFTDNLLFRESSNVIQRP